MSKALGVILFVTALVSPKYADLTLTNKDGGKEQHQVKLPFELEAKLQLWPSLYGVHYRQVREPRMEIPAKNFSRLIAK